MRKKMYSTPVVVLAILGTYVVLIGNCISVGSFINKTVKSITSEIQSYEPNQSDSYHDDFDEYNSVEDLEGVDPSKEALTDIACYETEGTTVSYTTERYQLQKQVGDNGVVLLRINYPVITGTDDAHTEEINKVLKDQAMVSADKYYLNVTERSETQAGSDGYLYIISEVTYRVSYLSDDFISVIYEDNYCAGDYNRKYVDMRSSNINLRTGKSYELNQIVKANNNLAEDFQQRLDDKYQYNEVIYGIDEDDYESMLAGNKECDDSFMGFYRTEDGVELFISCHYFTDDAEIVGWLTAPYRYEDIQNYQKNSDFWNLVQ